MFYGHNRYICDVLDEMRKSFSTYNFSSFMSLIEEAQIMANRMESSLGDLKNLRSLHDDISIEKKELKKLKKEKKKLEEEIESLKDGRPEVSSS